jgi:hypothetical protein
MQTLPNRFTRRKINKHNGFINLKSRLPFSAWCKFVLNLQKGGKELHNSNVDRQDKIYQEILEARELIKIEFWKSLGHNEEEIESLRTAFAITAIKNRDTWQVDKNIARKIFREVAESLRKRKEEGITK